MNGPIRRRASRARPRADRPTIGFKPWTSAGRGSGGTERRCGWLFLSLETRLAAGRLRVEGPRGPVPVRYRVLPGSNSSAVNAVATESLPHTNGVPRPESVLVLDEPARRATHPWRSGPQGEAGCPSEPLRPHREDAHGPLPNRKCRSIAR